LDYFEAILQKAAQQCGTTARDEVEEKARSATTRRAKSVQPHDAARGTVSIYPIWAQMLR
jgi:hypothetical protein